MELSKVEMELLLPLQGLWSKNFCYNIFSIFTKDFEIDFQTGNGIIQKGNGIISLLQGLWSKNFFYNSLSIFTNEQIWQVPACNIEFSCQSSLTCIS